MARKGDDNEEKQTGNGPEADAKAVSGQPGERQAAAVVEGDGGGAVDPAGAEQPHEAAVTPAPVDGDLSDGETSNPAMVQPPNNSTGNHGNEGSDPTCALSTVLRTEDASTNGNTGTTKASAPVGAADADNDEPVKELTDAEILDANIRYMAGQVLNQVLDGACDVLGATDPITADDINPHVFDQDTVIDVLVAYVRKIGRRATPEVMGHQLKILGHRKNPEISAPERIALSAFVSLLLDLDELAATERRRLHAAANPLKPADPLPIEETTMESSWGFFETF